ncbi:hypothetical protein HGO38_28065 [Rhizobium sp. CG5]|uniref:N-acetylmuramoyl-L-alanine amidase n=1 Tax=Rhizobium sp. CG5 TaxID=2726076 RepID=UPI0020337114|nr:N-acetylmuramoyl-L-alanine amidase [Rhizobium sp. CG5]MCM2477311.1 hypothetical protein [Rhizobium sp. CG5]
MSEYSLLDKLVSIYRDEEIRHPLLRAVTLAQWILESGRGTSELARDHYNFAGLKWRKEMAGFATKVAYDAHDGADFYCKFATMENFVAGYWAFLNRSPYSGWESHVATPEDFIGFIGPTYAPSNPEYAENVLNLVPEARQRLNAPRDAAPLDNGNIDTGKRSLGAIVIDPGHGGTQNMAGSDANHAISVSGVKEKKLTLDFCLLLRDEILSRARPDEAVKVVLTRDSDKNLPGRERARMALTHKAKLFLCLHFNGAANPSIRGSETYYRARENGNINLREDMAFATAVQSALYLSLKSLDGGARDRGIKPDNEGNPDLPGFGVLNDRNLGNDERPDPCRAAYIEAEFITNPSVEKLLISGGNAMANRRAAMGAVAEAVLQAMR